MTTTDSASRLEARVEELSRTVDELAARLQTLERELHGGGAVREAAAQADVFVPGVESLAEAGVVGAVVEEPAAASGGSALALVGRTLMVLGGAYLFRALTEAGTVPAHIGLMLGLVYAFVWLFFADRAAAAGRPRSAAFHGASFALIAEPLAWEAAGRFGTVGATGGALGVVLFTGCALAVAWKRNLRVVSWIAVLGAIFSAWALMASKASDALGDPTLPGVAVLVLVAVAADWLGLLRGWRGLPWVAALTANLTLASLTIKTAFGRLEELTAHQDLLWILVAFFLLSAGGTVARAVAHERWRPRWFDLAQVPASGLIGFGGAWVMVRALVRDDLAGAGLVLALGGVSLALAAGCYGVSFPLLQLRPERRPAYLLTSCLGLVLAIGGCGLVLGATGQAAVWSVLAVAGAWVCGRFRTVTIGLHAFLFAVLAAVVSGLMVEALVAFVSTPSAEWPVLSPVSIAVLVALAVASSLRLPADSPFWGQAARVPKFLLLGAFIWAAGGAALVVGLPWVAGGENGVALVAAVRTGFVALVALVLAWASRFERYREARWLVYVVLAAGAVKLLGEDLRLGRAGELFVALAVYGGALILAPRLARGSGEEGTKRAERVEEGAD